MDKIEKQIKEINDRLLGLETSHTEKYWITSIEPVFAASPHHAVRRFIDEIGDALALIKDIDEPYDERTINDVLGIIETSYLTAELVQEWE